MTLSPPAKNRAVRYVLAGLVATLAPTLPAHDAPEPAVRYDEPPELEEVVVEGRRQSLAGEARAASEGVIGQAQLADRPLLRPGDVLEAIPGLIVTQHSGSGKSNQMFLRGFNLDHGTDFATWVDGMPVNLRTHGHGQGYTDINFLIPELIRTIGYVKGPYYAEVGDFASAGAAFVNYYNELPRDRLEIGLGEFGYARALAASSANLEAGVLLGALEGQTYDGPWTDVNENFDKLNGLLRWSGEAGRRDFGASLMYYDASWNSADQIPRRAVSEGLIDPYGSLDLSTGGKTRRASLSGWLDWETRQGTASLNAYAIDYRLQLWSDFTYLLEDPVAGDQFEQLDDRTIWGGNLLYEWLGGGGGHHLHQRLGLEFRYDDISDVGLFNTRERQRIGTKRLDRVGETSVAAFYELEWRNGEHWRTVLGLRGDYYWFDVDSDEPANSGSASDGIVSPKLSFAYAFDADREAYLSAGLGFHSNDARGTTISVDPVTGAPVSPVDPLVRSQGAELGVRAAWRPGWNTTLALWYLRLDSELLYVGDAGATEASRPSRRWGIEFNNYWQLDEIWTLEADFAWNDAQFTDPAPEGDDIPGAIGAVITGAVTAQLPGGAFGSLRWRWFGPAPLIEDSSVESDGSTMLNLALGWSTQRWRLQLDVLNLLDSDDHDIDYYYVSRLPGEPIGGVEDVHFHIFEPRQFRASASWLF